MTAFTPNKAALVAALALLLFCRAPAGAQAFVIDGEEIADAATLAAAKKEGKVLVYGTWPERNFNPAIKANFEKETGITVDFVRMTTQVLFQRVTAEAAANRLAADFIDVTDPILLSQLVDRGILNVPHKVPSFDRIAAEAKDPQGRWYAFMRLPIGIGINTAVVKPEDHPKGWLDLLQPKWKGQIGASSLDVGGSAFTTWLFLRDKIGSNYWQRARELEFRVYPSVAPALADLVRGELSLAVMGVTSFQEQEAAGAPIKTVLPPEGSPILSIQGGIASTATHPKAAIVFVNWLASKHGGRFIAQQKAYAVNGDVPPPTLIGGAQFAPVNTLWDIELDRWEKIRTPVSEEWRKMFGRK